MHNVNEDIHDGQDPEVRERQRIVNLARNNERLMLDNRIPDNYQNMVLILGKTGSGKSTLINLLAGRSLSAQQHEGRVVLDSPNPLPGITIGHNVQAETSIPHSWMHDDNTLYWDCPGFNDNRPNEHAIANAFVIKKLFDICGNNGGRGCKIVLVVSQASLEPPQYEAFIDFVKSLDKIFRSNAAVRPGLMVAISRAEQGLTEIDIQTMFRSISDNPRLGLSDPQREIIRVLAANPIIIFKKPIEEGVFDRNNVLAQEYLDKIVHHLGVAHPENIDIGDLLPPGSRVAMIESYHGLSQSIKKGVSDALTELDERSQIIIANSNKQQLETALIKINEVLGRFANGMILSNQQLLQEVLPLCDVLGVNRDMTPTLRVVATTNSQQRLQKLEMFEFLEQFVDHRSNLNLDIKKSITDYLDKHKAIIETARDVIDKKEAKTATATVNQAIAALPPPRQHEGGGPVHVAKQIVRTINPFKW